MFDNFSHTEVQHDDVSRYEKTLDENLLVYDDVTSDNVNVNLNDTSNCHVIHNSFHFIYTPTLLNCIG